MMVSTAGQLAIMLEFPCRTIAPALSVSCDSHPADITEKLKEHCLSFPYQERKTTPSQKQNWPAQQHWLAALDFAFASFPDEERAEERERERERKEKKRSPFPKTKLPGAPGQFWVSVSQLECLGLPDDSALSRQRVTTLLTGEEFGETHKHSFSHTLLVLSLPSTQSTYC